MLSLEDDWQRPQPTPAQLRQDVVVGLVLVLSSVLMVELLRSTPAVEEISGRTLEAFAWGGGAVLPLVLRRRFPISVMVLCSLAFYGAGERVASVSYSVVIQIALFASIYTAWAWSNRRRALNVTSALVVLGMFVWLVQLIVTSPVPPMADAPGFMRPAVAIAVITIAVNIVYFFGAMAWGLAARRSAHRRELLEEQAADLRAERDLSARRAVADERLRIARDLHDVVAHHVTGIGVQAAAARHVLDRDPGSSREALAAIEGSSRRAVQEMHQLVGLLRDDQADSGAQPSLTGLRDLVAALGDDGPEVDYREVGDPFAVTPAVGTTAYRTVQEALTNVRRHSTARQAEVVLRYLDHPGTGPALEVEVLDDGSPRATTLGDRPGFGLTGVRERVGLHGGECEIGPRPDGGFRVRVRLPVETAGVSA
ncbi:MAG: sensor histidine kinase [Nocardioides sp.]